MRNFILILQFIKILINFILIWLTSEHCVADCCFKKQMLEQMSWLIGGYFLCCEKVHIRNNSFEYLNTSCCCFDSWLNLLRWLCSPALKLLLHPLFHLWGCLHCHWIFNQHFFKVVILEWSSNANIFAASTFQWEFFVAIGVQQLNHFLGRKYPKGGCTHSQNWQPDQFSLFTARPPT